SSEPETYSISLSSRLVSEQVIFSLLPRNHSSRHVSQTGAQRFVRPEKQRLHRGLRAVKRPCDLRIFHLFVFVHQDRRSLFFRQRLDGLLYLRQPRLIYHCLFHVRPDVGNLAHRLIFRTLIQALLISLVLAVAQRVEGEMRRDTEQPRSELRCRL